MRKMLMLALLLLVLGALPALAQKCEDSLCEPYSEDPGDSCLGPEDPFCTAGGGGGTISTCYRCAYKWMWGLMYYRCCSGSNCDYWRDEHNYIVDTKKTVSCSTPDVNKYCVMRDSCG